MTGEDTNQLYYWRLLIYSKGAGVKASILRVKKLQESEAELIRKKESGSQASQAAMEIIPTAQHILDNYDVLTIAEKNRLWKLVMKKATVYRTPDGELSVHIYPKLPK